MTATPLRVAFVALSPFISGAERSLQLTLAALPGAGVAPVVIGPPDGALRPWCETHDVPYSPCDLAQWDSRTFWKYGLSVLRLRRLLQRHRAEVLHSNQLWSFQAASRAAGSLGIVRVCHFRDDAEPGAIGWFTGAGVEAVVCISQHIQRQAECAWPEPARRPRLFTRINPVDIRDRSIEERQRLRADARRRLAVKDGEVVFGFAGQLREVKGLLPLLEVCAALPLDRAWRLMVAGRDPSVRGDYERRCRERAEQPDLKGRVYFLGFLENMSDFYQALDLAVVPSFEEPMGRIPLEAASYAVPSVAFRVGGLPDVIVDGETGRLVPADDWAALRRELAATLDHPDDGLGEKAYQWVRRVSDPHAYAAALADLYRQLIEERSRR